MEIKSISFLNDKQADLPFRMYSPFPDSSPATHNSGAYSSTYIHTLKLYLIKKKSNSKQIY